MKEIFMHPNLSAAWKKCYFFETCSRNELLKVQDAKLKGLLFHTATTVPYYKNFFAEKGIPIDKLTLADFPIIEKKDIRGHEQEFVSKAKGLNKITWSRTSGSTGEPFRFGRSEFDYTYATLWRGMLRYGIRPGDKRVLVKGVDESTTVSLKTMIKRWVYGILNRCIVVDAHFLAKSKDNILKALSRIVKYKPVYIHKVCFCKITIDWIFQKLHLLNQGNLFFSSFEKLNGGNVTSICKVTQAIWEEYTPTVGGSDGTRYLVFTVTANRFLRNMVRAIVGSLIEVGRGKKDPSWISGLIASGSRSNAGQSVPGNALFFCGAEY